MIYWQISFEKYVPKHLISLLYYFYFIFFSSLFNNLKKTDSENVTTQIHDFERRHALKLSNYASWKSFICLKWILKNVSITLHTQFNYRTLNSRSVPFFDLIISRVVINVNKKSNCYLNLMQKTLKPTYSSDLYSDL